MRTVWSRPEILSWEPTLGATRMYDLPVLRTYLNNGQRRDRGHELF